LGDAHERIVIEIITNPLRDQMTRHVSS